jgi:myo-inositol 2-dehydrogenase / D-chiro-inositol 1-dehydrogenase
MPEQAEVRLGLVGCGRLAARGYLPAFRRASGVRLAAVADVDLTRCRALAPDVPAYDSARALAAASGIDGVVIATPTRAHASDARAVAEAGILALVEKPPGLHAAEAASLASLRPEPRIGFNRRFEPGLARLRADVARPNLDLILRMQYRRRAWGSYDMQDDALLDLAPHLVDLARWLTGGEARRVCARTLTRQRAVFAIELGDHRATIGCASHRVFAEHVEARDARRRLVARYRCGGFAQAIRDRLLPPAESPLITTLARQLEAFGHAVRGGAGAPLATATDGLAVMCVLDAVRRSAAAGGRWCAPEEHGRDR